MENLVHAGSRAASRVRGFMRATGCSRRPKSLRGRGDTGAPDTFPLQLPAYVLLKFPDPVRVDCSKI